MRSSAVRSAGRPALSGRIEPLAGVATGGRRRFIYVLLAVLAFTVVVKLPSLRYPRKESDEVIYWELAKNLATKGEYTLRGSPVLSKLSPHMYDRELFHHPPLFSALLVPFVKADSKEWAVVISWIGHLLCIAAVALLGRALLSGRRPFPTVLFLIPLFGMALDPFLTFMSRKLWMDSLLAGLVALAVALYFIACRSRRRRTLLVAAGIFLGLAALTKLTALLIAPVAVFIIFFGLETWRERITACLWGGIPALVLIAPWFVVFYQHYGVLTPGWIKPDAWLLNRYPLMRQIVGRPAWFYPKQIFLAQPLVALLVFAALAKPARFGNAAFAFPFLWFLVFLGGLTWIGTRGYGFNMRFLAPLFPSLYVMLYAVFGAGEERKRPAFTFLSLLCILYAGIGAGVFLFFPCDEINSMLQLVGIVK